MLIPSFIIFWEIKTPPIKSEAHQFHMKEKRNFYQAGKMIFDFIGKYFILSTSLSKMINHILTSKYKKVNRKNDYYQMFFPVITTPEQHCQGCKSFAMQYSD